ncbi:DUF3037 domain-containing protein [Sinomicrobium weinanense]|uniref:DUF3037 domain-containing protein n=1 Tax=Sinomicrobium weinanense TaxID=2842200 RepID=A0A926JPP7_9FLAO|nr:DUF3037 domain-containing protein [Sinomicrobium weinanense]MBC9795012.1 DUF3037 domain-containing protein [Sinomicrobium weinanense]MBU3125127.1 DUF3037 domain-containing protein [Sinomicrobium weinanense]
MREKLLYEYAVIRLVPRVEREEFLNVGVVLFCKETAFLQTLYHIDEEKLKAFGCETDREQLKENLASFDKISRGCEDGGPIARLDLPSRFRWLTAVRSSVIQTSRPHPGFSSDPEETLQKLFRELVL